jgi:predicted negative regulator of RcsB-dependent stress response
MSRKELRRPDEITVLVSRLYELGKPYRRHISYGLAGLVVVVVGAMLWSYFAGRGAAEASLLFSRAARTYDAEVQATTSLPAAEDDASAEPAGSDDGARFKTDRERLEATLRAFDEVLKEHGSGRVGAETSLARAGVLYDLGRYDDAAKAYAAFLDGQGDSPLAFLAREGLGYAYEGKGELDKALTEFRALDQVPIYHQRAMFHQARLLALKGDHKTARGLYQRVAERADAAPWLRERARERLAALTGK